MLIQSIVIAISDLILFVKYQRHHGKTAKLQITSGEVIALLFYTLYKTLCCCYWWIVMIFIIQH